MIITRDLKANVEKEIDVTGGTHVKIKNLGNCTIYVSKHSNIVAGADGVKSVQGSTTDILVDVATYYSKENILNYYGTIYAISDSDCKVELETTNNANFKQIVKGGGNSSTSSVLDDVLKSNTVYQLGELTSNITITLPETAGNDIELDFAIGDTVHNINCDYLSLNVVANTYYQIIFSYDKSLSMWFASIVSSDYNSILTTAEVSTDETD